MTAFYYAENKYRVEINEEGNTTIFSLITFWSCESTVFAKYPLLTEDRFFRLLGNILCQNHLGL